MQMERFYVAPPHSNTSLLPKSSLVSFLPILYNMTPQEIVLAGQRRTVTRGDSYLLLP
jgi:hypothetical protein